MKDKGKKFSYLSFDGTFLDGRKTLLPWLHRLNNSLVGITRFVPGMLTRREKLLVRPWQLRRYNSHRKKVLSALPVIDFGPPPERGHVTVKLKKLQLEDERQTKIEEDNFRLLQRMGAIMKKNRLDNYWETKPPTFLRRVSIYHRTRTPSPLDVLTPDTSQTDSNFRKSRCLACSGQLSKLGSSPIEERIPWEPPKKSPSKRTEESAKKKLSSREVTPSRRETKTTGSCLPYINTKKSGKAVAESCGKQIVFEQGSFQLSLNFPIYVDVKVKSAKGEQYVQKGYCTCQALEGSDHKLTA